MTPLGRSITDRPRPSEPAFVPDPPRVHLSRARLGFAILCTLIGSWLIAVTLIWIGCIISGACR